MALDIELPKTVREEGQENDSLGLLSYCRVSCVVSFAMRTLFQDVL